ncbi:MAG: GPR endopeptidase [Lachnospiraceae bacterium]|nr:GPR endopeptidase [Lachnospiraceae bacterium]
MGMKRTDLALETKECVEAEKELKGVSLTRIEEHGMCVSTVQILTEKAEKIMGKARGTYITIEERENTSMEMVGQMLAKQLSTLLDVKKIKTLLVVGLGNREITPDALGPLTVDEITISRHMYTNFGTKAKKWGYGISVEAIAPGVMAQTGMEVLEVVKGLQKETKPEAIVVIDALAARSVHRLFRTIQLTDTGIAPGAGVGNRRCALNQKKLGIPVIAIGVPTVVDSQTIVEDFLEKILEEMKLDKENGASCFEKMEKEKIESMIMTDKEVDQKVQNCAACIGMALDLFAGHKLQS